MTRTLIDGETEEATDSLVFMKIENEWDAKNNFASNEQRVRFLTEIRDEWLAKRSRQAARETEKTGSDVARRSSDSSEQVAFHFLNNAESTLVNEAMLLSLEFTKSRATVDVRR